jgi:hypothetical protein
MYGQGDLTQAFCCCAVVCGALQYLGVLIPFSCVHYMRMVDCDSFKGYVSFSAFKAFGGFECSLRSAH